jgi:hypothetical protein
VSAQPPNPLPREGAVLEPPEPIPGEPMSNRHEPIRRAVAGAVAIATRRRQQLRRRHHLVWIISPEGRHLGTIRAPELPANFAWGDDDGKTLYMTRAHGPLPDSPRRAGHPAVASNRLGGEAPARRVDSTWSPFTMLGAERHESSSTNPSRDPDALGGTTRGLDVARAPASALTRAEHSNRRTPAALTHMQPVSPVIARGPCRGPRLGKNGSPPRVSVYWNATCATAAD